MLTKAILTGGVLALLSGSIVYFGTEGADALDSEAVKDALIQDTELAGAPVSETKVVKTADAKRVSTPAKENMWVKKADRMKKAEAQDAAAKSSTDETNVDMTKTVSADPIDPPVKKKGSKPKTKWLDQYLKSSKSKKEDEKPSVSETEEPSEMSEAEEPKDKELAKTAPNERKSLAIDAHEDGTFRYSDGTIVEDEADLEYARQALEAIAGVEGSEESEDSDKREENRENIVIEIENESSTSWSTDGEDIDMKMIEELLRDSEDMKKDTRILRLDRKSSKMKKRDSKSKKTVAYDVVLEEARKLQVIDMRNIAFFEIIDYAVDRNDFGKAADILQELSDPELRDTARAKIGVGLAKTGDSDAAFAVLDEMEIDELTASIRLEIITALVATKSERLAPMGKR